MSSVEMNELCKTWRRICLRKTDVELRTLLTCGQSFTWRETSKDVWTNVLDSTIFCLKQTESEILWSTPFRDVDCSSTGGSETLAVDRYANSEQKSPVGTLKQKRAATPSNSYSISSMKIKKDHNNFKTAVTITDEQADAILRDYFQLNVDLPALYKEWSARDTHFCKISGSFPGIRIMRQDPTENLFSFICSSNNHVSRISGMVSKLAEHYGGKLGSIGNMDFYSFPTAADLDQPNVEAKLRGLGFGYR